MKRTLIAALLVFATLLVSAPALSIAAPPSVEERVATAEMVFVGKLINRIEVEGDWVHAELQVTEPLLKAKVGEKVPVTWRLVRFNDAVIFDCQEGKQGVAILGDMHQGRYWLRDDKFLSMDLLDDIKKAVEKVTKTEKP